MCRMFEEKTGYFAAIFVVLVVLSPNLAHAELYMRGSGSTITIGQGASLALEKSVNGFNGKLVQDDKSSLQGKSIHFAQGRLESNGRSSILNGSLNLSDTSNIIQLAGDQTIIGNGLTIPYSLKVHGKNNRVEGNCIFSGPIVLEDSQTTLTCAMYRMLNQDVLLNGGTLYLDNDLVFADGCNLQGPGVVEVNDKQLLFGMQELVWDQPLTFRNAYDITLLNDILYAAPITFQGTNLINGQSNWIALHDDGEIIIDRNSTLVLNNINLAHVSGNKIRCIDDSSTLVLTNVTINMLDDYSFTIGSLLVNGDCVIKGNGDDIIFTYNSNMTMTLDMASSLWIDYGITLSFDSGRDNLYTTVCGSQLVLNGATLHVTRRGLNLAKNIFVVGENAQIYIEDNTIDPTTGSIINNGLTLGNDDVEADNKMRFLPGASLEIVHGKIIYKNVDYSSWRMPTVNSILQMDAGTQLVLDQPLNLQRGCLKMSSNASILQNNGASVTGFVDCF